MRIPSTFGEKPIVSQSVNAEKKYFLVFEGIKTEIQYFEGVVQWREEIGINPLIKLIPIIRDSGEKTWSNPQKITETVIRQLNFEKGTGEIDAYILEEYILEFMAETDIFTPDTLYNFEDVSCSVNEYFQGIGKVQIVQLPKMMNTLSERLAEELSMEQAPEKLLSHVYEQKIGYQKDFDCICIIVDRDKQSFKEIQFDQVMTLCKENNFKIFITNPCFEFWLLLHFDAVKEYANEKLLENPKKTKSAKKRFLEEELSVLLGGYNKNKLDFAKFKDKIPIAIANERYYCEDLEKLKTNLGSNLGFLFESILNKEKRDK